MASVKFFLDKRKGPKKDGTYLLKLCIIHECKVKYVSLKLSLKDVEWNAKEQLVTSKHKRYRTLNTWLFDQIDIAKDVLLSMKMEPGSERFQAADYAERIEAKLNGKELHRKPTFAEHLLKFASLKKDTTRKLYHDTLTLMRKFDPKADKLRFEDITKEWLTAFDANMAKTSKSQNYRNIHLRNIRAVFNSAIDDEITTCYPFRRFKIKAVETDKRSLDVEQLRKLFNYPVEDYQKEYLDMFKLMFFLCGINSTDLFHLKELKDGRVVFNRAKTGKLYSIKVEPEAMEIIERWRGKDYLLSVGDRYKDHRNYTHRMNLALQRIGEVERKGRGGKKIIKTAFPDLTTYWSRHTWATLAAEIDIPDSIISQGLGHAAANSTTEIYIRRNRKKVDDANRKLIDWVLYGKSANPQ